MILAVQQWLLIKKMYHTAFQRANLLKLSDVCNRFFNT